MFHKLTLRCHIQSFKWSFRMDLQLAKLFNKERHYLSLICWRWVKEKCQKPFLSKKKSCWNFKLQPWTYNFNVTTPNQRKLTSLDIKVTSKAASATVMPLWTKCWISTGKVWWVYSVQANGIWIWKSTTQKQDWTMWTHPRISCPFWPKWQMGRLQSWKPMSGKLKSLQNARLF